MQACFPLDNVTSEHYVRVSGGWPKGLWISYRFFMNGREVRKRHVPVVRIIVVVRYMTTIEATNFILVFDTPPQHRKVASCVRIRGL